MRRGITPVVAVTLLLMMTVASAGGAYTWFTQIQEQAQEQASAQLSTELTVKDTICRGGSAYIFITNTGEADIQGDELLVTILQDGSVVTADRRTVTGGFMTTGGSGWLRAAGDTLLDAGTRYTLEADVIAGDATVSAGCTAEPVGNWGFEDGPTGNNVYIDGWAATVDWLDHDSDRGVIDGSYAYGEEGCCDAYDDGSGQGVGQWDLYRNITGDLDGAWINASVAAEIKSDVDGVGNCASGQVYMGEDDARLFLTAYDGGTPLQTKRSYTGAWYAARQGYSGDGDNTTRDVHDYVTVWLNWTVPSGTDTIEVDLVAGEATDSCVSWTNKGGGNSAVYFDHFLFTANVSTWSG